MLAKQAFERSQSFKLFIYTRKLDPVVKNSKSKVKFWLLSNYASPQWKVSARVPLCRAPKHLFQALQSFLLTVSAL